MQKQMQRITTVDSGGQTEQVKIVGREDVRRAKWLPWV